MASQIAVGAAEPGCKKVDPILVADKVKRQFGGLVAVDVDHVEIPRGMITALIAAVMALVAKSPEMKNA